MTRVWGIHGRRPRLDFVRDGLIALERPKVGDVAALGGDASAIFAALREAYPTRSPGTLRAWTAALVGFAADAQAGDVVVHPDPATRTVSVGVITGPYVLADPARGLHRRAADWSRTAIPVATLSLEAQRALTHRSAFFPLGRSGRELAELLG